MKLYRLKIKRDDTITNGKYITKEEAIKAAEYAFSIYPKDDWRNYYEIVEEEINENQ